MRAVGVKLLVDSILAVLKLYFFISADCFVNYTDIIEQFRIITLYGFIY